MTSSPLPAVNATLNSISFILLVAGYIAIKNNRMIIHKRLMISALVSSGLFLTTYLIYHYRVGSVPYPYHDWSRPVYFTILIPHIILAGAMLPFIFVALRYALTERFDKHRRVVRFLWPVWIFVSLSGVAVYFLLYRPWKY
jgi:putative membrane protein